MAAKKRVGVFTAGRSDYGNLREVLREAVADFEVELLVTGAHFCAAKGESFREILHDGIIPEKHLVKVPAFLDSDSPEALGKSVGLAQISFAQVLASRAFDAIIVFGDRFELFGISVPAVMQGIPLLHISGGEITEGVVDDSIRHAHTKLSHLHCAATREYAENIRCLGEEDWRIVVAGECGLDEVHAFRPVPAKTLARDLDLDLAGDILLITFHPSNLDFELPLEAQIDPLLRALGGFPAAKKIFTAPGFEAAGNRFAEKIEAYVAADANARFHKNLGRTRYLSLMKGCAAVVGNSSSGIVEAPSFGVPTLNIGSRQQHRLAASSVHHVNNRVREITAALRKLLAGKPSRANPVIDNPYDPYQDGRNSRRIVFALKKALALPRETLLQKRFNRGGKAGGMNHLLKGFA